MNTILLVISLIIFLAYIIYVFTMYGVLPSISDSYYLEKDKWVFTIFIWIIAFIFIIVGSTGLMFFAGAFLAFVGAAPAFKDDKMTEKVHMVGAIGGITLGFISMWIDFHLWFLPLTMVLFALSTTTYLKVKNYTWWIEVVAFFLMIFGLFIVRT